MGSFSYTRPCHTQAGKEGEEVKAHGGGLLSPKEIWQSHQIDDQDRGGIPNPQEVPMATTYRVTGVGRHSGSFTHEFTDAQKATDFARACVKKAASPSYAATIKLTRALTALEQGNDVAVAPSGRVIEVSRRGDRAYAPPGYVIQATRRELRTRLGKTCNEGYWKDAGWALGLVAQ